ncbi:MAG: hypothetical protein K0R57_4085 [Paenibacillaceae bacterium]|jgi:GntR family transcriptional repressor for pyruvate dehydrogenase complex|nr:hypothetical protein [Paenibacillaceae bacterium]
MEAKDSGKAYKRVVQHIKEEILRQNLKHGERLPPERELAEQLGVSRNSVREALRTLDVLGVITSTQGAGNSVSVNFEKSMVESLSFMFLMRKTDYEQISELRKGLEEQAIVLAAERITPGQIMQLEELAEQLAASDDEMTNVILDKKLHYTIAQASGNPLIFSILQALSNVMDLFISDLRRQIIADEPGRKRLQHIHERLVHSLKKGDKAGALAAMSNHFVIIDENLAAFRDEM